MKDMYFNETDRGKLLSNWTFDIVVNELVGDGRTYNVVAKYMNEDDDCTVRRWFFLTDGVPSNYPYFFNSYAEARAAVTEFTRDMIKERKIYPLEQYEAG